MFGLKAKPKKSLRDKKQISVILIWKIFVTSVFAIFIIVVFISYSIFSKADQDPFISDDSASTSMIKQYNADKVQRIKNYFDERQTIYNTTVGAKMQISDPSI